MWPLHLKRWRFRTGVRATACVPHVGLVELGWHHKAPKWGAQNPVEPRCPRCWVHVSFPAGHSRATCDSMLIPVHGVPGIDGLQTLQAHVIETQLVCIPGIRASLRLMPPFDIERKSFICVVWSCCFKTRATSASSDRSPQLTWLALIYLDLSKHHI